MKRLIVVVCSVLALASCTAEGDDFSVHMRITKVGRQSVTGQITQIDNHHGWFTLNNTHQIHDNCDCHGAWNGSKRYGSVFNYEGTQIALSDLRDRQCLHLIGQIRADQEGKYTNDRPVFDTAQQEPC